MALAERAPCAISRPAPRRCGRGQRRRNKGDPPSLFSKLFQISALSKSFRGIGLFLAVFQPSSRPAAVRGHRSPNGCVTLWDGRDAFMARSDPDAENLEPSLDS